MLANEKRKGILFLLCLLLLLPALHQDIAFGNDEVQNTNDELNKIEDELKAIDKERSNKTYEQNKVLRNIRDLETNVKKLESEMTRLGDEVAATESKIYETEEKLKVAEEGISIKKDLLSSRLRVMYKTGKVGYLEVLLGASDFSDLMTRVDMLQKVYTHDMNLIDYMSEQKDLVVERKTQLEQYKDERQVQMNELNGKKRLLEGDMSQLEGAKVALSKDLKALEAKEDELEEDARKLTEILKQLTLKETYVGGEMIWPTPGYTRVSSPFGYRIHPIYKTRKLHTGIDIAIPTGGGIVAAQSGTVIYADWYGGYGKCIMIDHGGGIVTLYAHNSKIKVKVGQQVTVGESISEAGATGNVTGAHLHFEIRVNGEMTDPLERVQP